MKNLTIMLIIALVLVLYIITKKTEYLTSDEALQNIATLYNKNNMTVTNLNVTNNLTANNFTGIIVAYSGTTIPNGWAPCDGGKYKLDGAGKYTKDQSGAQTPDLRGRFICGVNPDDNPPKDSSGNNLREKLDLNVKGGEEMHTLTVSEMPTHTHIFNKRQIGCEGPNCTVKESAYQVAGITTKEWDYKMPTYDNFKNDPAGESKPHNNMPPYYVLLYIMKL